MKIFNAAHFLRHIRPAILGEFAQAHSLAKNFSPNWFDGPTEAIHLKLNHAVATLGMKLSSDELPATQKGEIECDLYIWQEDLRRAHDVASDEGIREIQLTLASDTQALIALEGLDPKEQALWLLTHREQAFRDVELRLAFAAKVNGRYWKVHKILPNLIPTADPASLQAFCKSVCALYQQSGAGLGSHIEVSKREFDGSVQFTLYVEGPVKAIAQFCEHDFKRIAVRVALETALVYHPATGVVETVVKGGVKNHATVLKLFALHVAQTELLPEAIEPKKFKLNAISDRMLAPSQDWSVHGIEKVRLRRAKFTPANCKDSTIQVEVSAEKNCDDAIIVAREKLKAVNSFNGEFNMDRATLTVYTQDVASQRFGQFSFDLYASGSSTIKNLSQRNQFLANQVLCALGVVESAGVGA